jgi:mannose-6-phosphate isomerase-like protein (cupin superfamily)
MPSESTPTPQGQLVRAADLELLSLKSTRDGGAVRYLEGGRYGLATSIFASESVPGSGAGTHSHPYAEVFVLHEGTGRFAVDDAEIDAEAGDVVIVQAGAWHSFTNSGPALLRLTAIHEAPIFSRVLPPKPDER